MRRSYLDNIRGIAVILVVLYHVIYLYNGIDSMKILGAFSDTQPQDTIQYVLYPWFMVLLFLISGMSARYYLETHSGKAFFKARTRKLLIPSTIGILLFGWIQGYINLSIAGALETIEAPKTILFLIMTVSGTGVLWFIQVLWICCVVLLGFRRLEKDRVYARLGRQNIFSLCLLTAPVWCTAQLLNMPVIVVYRFGISLFVFLLGYYVFSHDCVTDILVRYCIPLSLASVVMAAGYVWYYFGQNYAQAPVVNSVFSIVYAWTVCLSCIGCAKRWFDHSSRFAVFMNRNGFGMYVFHYLALSAVGLLLHRYTACPAVLSYLLCATAGYGGSIILFKLVRRIPIVRWCVLGIKKEKKSCSKTI